MNEGQEACPIEPAYWTKMNEGQEACPIEPAYWTINE